MLKNISKLTKKQVLLFIVLPILIATILIVCICTPILIANTKTIEDIQINNENISNINIEIGENLDNITLDLKFKNNIIQQIKLSELLNDNEIKKLSTVGTHKVKLIYDNFEKEITITVNAKNFSNEEKELFYHENMIVEYRPDGYFFDVKNLPVDMIAKYSVNNKTNYEDDYKIITPGSYVINVKISKENYNDYDFSFSVIIKNSFSLTIDGFDLHNDIFSSKVDCNTNFLNFENLVKLEDTSLNYDIYQDELLAIQLDKSNVPLSYGINFFYINVFSSNNSTNKIYKIEVYRNQIFNVNFYFEDRILKTIKVEENSYINDPLLTIPGYNILGWSTDNTPISFPYQITKHTNFKSIHEYTIYNIEYILDDGTLSNGKYSYTINDADFTLPYPTKNGYEFIGWTGSNLSEITKNVVIKNGTIGNLKFTAHFKLLPSTFKQGVYTNWMSFIDKDVKIMDIIMPGSHDAGTKGAGGWVETQQSDFYNQLIGGVRYFDMRVTEVNGRLMCVHADSNQPILDRVGLPFDSALNDFNRFITENPSEVLILDFQHIWSDFNSKVIPKINSTLNYDKILNKNITESLSDITMETMRNYNKNFIIIVRDGDKSSPNFGTNPQIYERNSVLFSPYNGGAHKGSPDRLIAEFNSYYSQKQQGKFFVLQSQRTGFGSTQPNLYYSEQETREPANKFARSLSLVENKSLLLKTNIIMRDFVVDDIGIDNSGQQTIQSIIFLNIFKENINKTKLPDFKILIDYNKIINLPI